MYRVLYRKWRPQTFEGVRFAHITAPLESICTSSSGRVAHAYLFTGSRGTGAKTASSRRSRILSTPLSEAVVSPQ